MKQKAADAKCRLCTTGIENTELEENRFFLGGILNEKKQ